MYLRIQYSFTNLSPYNIINNKKDMKVLTSETSKLSATELQPDFILIHTCCITSAESIDINKLKILSPDSSLYYSHQFRFDPINLHIYK